MDLVGQGTGGDLDGGAGAVLEAGNAAPVVADEGGDELGRDVEEAVGGGLLQQLHQLPGLREVVVVPALLIPLPPSSPSAFR